MRHLVGVVAGPWVIGRVRAVLLVVVAAAALADLTAYAVLVGDDASEAAAPPGPDEVALTVLRAVADDDCAGIGDLVADDADLPFTVTACLDGADGGAPIGGVRVLGAETDGSSAAVTVALTAGAQEAEFVVDLARDGDRWQVTGLTTG